MGKAKRHVAEGQGGRMRRPPGFDARGIGARK